MIHQNRKQHWSAKSTLGTNKIPRMTYIMHSYIYDYLCINRILMLNQCWSTWLLNFIKGRTTGGKKLYLTDWNGQSTIISQTHIVCLCYPGPYNWWIPGQQLYSQYHPFSCCQPFFLQFADIGIWNCFDCCKLKVFIILEFQACFQIFYCYGSICQGRHGSQDRQGLVLA